MQMKIAVLREFALVSQRILCKLLQPTAAIRSGLMATPFTKAIPRALLTANGRALTICLLLLSQLQL